MAHVFVLVSTGAGAGLTTVSLGMLRALDRLGIRAGFCKPIAQLHDGDHGPERSTQMIQKLMNMHVPKAISLRRATMLLGNNQEGLLMEEVVALYQESAKHSDVVIIEGLVADGHAGYATRLNKAIVQALDAEVILVASPEPDIMEYIDIAENTFGEDCDAALIGVILNKVGEPSEGYAALEAETVEPLESDVQFLSNIHSFMAAKPFKMIATIPWQAGLVAPRSSDVARYLGAELLFAGEMNERRMHRVELCASTLTHTLAVYQPHTMLIFPGDREDVFVASCMAVMNGVPLAGVLLTGGRTPSASVLDLCKQALKTGLPVLTVGERSFKTAEKLARMPQEVAVDDIALVEQGMEHIANHLDVNWLKERCAVVRKPRLTPAAFRYQLIQQASRTNRRIVLPEGNEPRTIVAAYQCTERGIAHCILLGNADDIHQVAKAQGVKLGKLVQIIDPEHVRSRYIEPMVALRQHKGLTSQAAEDQLQDHVVLGTMMLAVGEVDGLVSGAEHTTANTVRPALQLIGTRESAKLVSSIFFMCLPEQVVVYGDCAINPEPDAEQLADIAVQSADSARHFGLEPSVAMISYSTGESGTGSDVEKVRQATQYVHQYRPDLMVDGPLQYDAASVVSVGKSKSPKSLVAGKANVFIFPDLNTGNTTYKAVQRSAHVVSIGPMLQGLKKPVNDLSRGASVEDVVYTIAITAIQSIPLL
jgi:phosphate acetyltransferase